LADSVPGYFVNATRLSASQTGDFLASPTKEIQNAAYPIADSGKNNIGTDKSEMSGRLFFLDAGGGRVIWTI